MVQQCLAPSCAQMGSRREAGAGDSGSEGHPYGALAQSPLRQPQAHHLLSLGHFCSSHSLWEGLGEVGRHAAPTRQRAGLTQGGPVSGTSGNAPGSASGGRSSTQRSNGGESPSLTRC